jgi:2-polyprenyl-6-methoxyphenol hydroxylase-like FAD-dependent oxidoreductase
MECSAELTAEDERRVLIIGAGPAGLAAAAAFSRVHIRAEVFERAHELREVGAGLGLQTNALRALIRIGIGGYMIDHGSPVEWQEFYSRRGRLLARLPQGEVARQKGVPGVNIRRSDLQRGLLRAVDARRIHLSAECVAVEQEDDCAVAHFADGRRERGALIVGADGLHSVVRAFMHGKADARYSGFTIWRGIATVDPDLVPFDVVRLYSGAGAQFGIFPLPGQEIYWSASVVAPATGRHAPDGQRAECLRYFAEFPAPAATLIEGTPDAAIVRNDIYDRDPISPWSKGRWVLIGDAAHPTTPFMGQGAGIAIEDAIVLAKELSLSSPLTEFASIRLALESYELRRADRANSIVLASRRRGEAAKSNALLCALRNTAMKRIPDRKWRQDVAESIAYDV